MVEPRKLSEPFNPKPVIRKLPQRKMSDVMLFQPQSTYANLQIEITLLFAPSLLALNRSLKKANLWVECRD